MKTVTVSAEQRDVLLAYARSMADDLGLRDWSITIEDSGPSEESHAAAMFADYGSRRLRLYFREDFPTLSAEVQRATVAHELLHGYLEPLDWYLLETLPELLGKPAWSAVRQAIRQHLETAIDGIAIAVAPHLAPLIWVAEREPATA